LKEAAETAKIELSSALSTDIMLPYIFVDTEGAKNLNVTLTRAKLEQLTAHLIDRSMKPCELALKDAGLTKDQIEAVVLVGGMTRMPAVQQAVEKFFGKPPTKGVNPDEVVALGAAVQAGVLQGDVKGILLLDVTPLTLSLETLGGVATPMIPRNTTIPTRKSQVYSTAADSQTQVELHIMQGERPMAADNTTLGKFILDGLPPAPRGLPQIEVTFDIDANGILNVSAKDKATGREQKVVITGATGLKKEEIDRLVREAEAHAAEDAQRRDVAEANNQADSVVFTAEKMMTEHADKLPEPAKAKTAELITAVNNARSANNTEQIKSATEALAAHIQQLGGSMYQQPPTDGASENGAAGDGTGNGKGEDVVDAEFTEA
jgi:molecular chaperone DnaK